ncbi:MAG: hypothetical protein PVF67_14815 [Anaerolineae bacterium]
MADTTPLEACPSPVLGNWGISIGRNPWSREVKHDRTPFALLALQGVGGAGEHL